jgi:hypothetical protein
VLSSRDPIIRRAELGQSGAWYRVHVGPFATSEQATALCNSLKDAGGQCIVQKDALARITPAPVDFAPMKVRTVPIKLPSVGSFAPLPYAKPKEAEPKPVHTQTMDVGDFARAIPGVRIRPPSGCNKDNALTVLFGVSC